MTYKDIQEVQNASAMVEIENIRFEERLLRLFANAEDAHAFLYEQPNADKLYVRRIGGLFAVRPIVILDADNIPVRDGDILFLRGDRYCRAKIVKYKRNDGAHNILLQGMRVEGDTNAVAENFGENDGRVKIVFVKHHRRDERERKSLSEWIYNIVKFFSNVFDIHLLLAMLIIFVTLPFWLVVLIVWTVTVIRDEKALKKAEAAEAALIFADDSADEDLSSESKENEYSKQCYEGV